MFNCINRCLRRTPSRASLEESKQNELTHENERTIPLQAEHSERLERTPQTTESLGIKCIEATRIESKYDPFQQAMQAAKRVCQGSGIISDETIASTGFSRCVAIISFNLHNNRALLIHKDPAGTLAATPYNQHYMQLFLEKFQQEDNVNKSTFVVGSSSAHKDDYISHLPTETFSTGHGHWSLVIGQ